MDKIPLIEQKYRLDKIRVRKIFQTSKKKNLFFGGIKVLIRDSESFRCGIIVPRKVFGPRSAVKRNYIRRFFYDEFFRSITKKGSGMKGWYLFYIKEKNSDIETIKQKLITVFNKLTDDEFKVN